MVKFSLRPVCSTIPTLGSLSIDDNDGNGGGKNIF